LAQAERSIIATLGEIPLSEAVQVRPVQRADFPHWKQLWDGYNEFYGRAGDAALASEVTLMTWSRFFDAYEPMHALVAEVSERIVGLVHFLYHRSTIQIAPTCYLADLFTADAVRGQGVGGALISAVYTCAKRAGSPRVYWQTHETNTVAMRLYDQVAERSGFLVYRRGV
jgi:GNAT superfamily N-acetyltransferase